MSVENMLTFGVTIVRSSDVSRVSSEPISGFGGSKAIHQPSFSSNVARSDPPWMLTWSVGSAVGSVSRILDGRLSIILARGIILVSLVVLRVILRSGKRDGSRRGLGSFGGHSIDGNEQPDLLGRHHITVPVVLGSNLTSVRDGRVIKLSLVESPLSRSASAPRNRQ